MQQTLARLKAELAKGHEQMLTLDQRRQELRDTMLRISGAVQVLEELLKEAEANEPGASHAINGAAPATAPVG